MSGRLRSVAVLVEEAKVLSIKEAHEVMVDYRSRFGADLQMIGR